MACRIQVLNGDDSQARSQVRQSEGARAQTCARRWIEGIQPAVTQPVVHGQHGREAMSPAGTGKMGRSPQPEEMCRKLCTGGWGWLLGIGMRPLDGGPDKLLGLPTLVSNDDA